MKQNKGIAIRLDKSLLQEIENHDLSRNILITNAIKEYLHSSQQLTNNDSEKQKKKSTWTTIEEQSKKLNKNRKQPSLKPRFNQPEETITENLYNEIYSTLYNTEIIPLKKQFKLKNELIETLQKQNNILQEDKEFLFHHITKLEQRIPKKHSWFKKKETKIRDEE